MIRFRPPAAHFLADVTSRLACIRPPASFPLAPALKIPALQDKEFAHAKPRQPARDLLPGKSSRKPPQILGVQPLVGWAESGFSKAARRAQLSPEIIRISGRIARCPSHEGLSALDLRRLLSDFPGSRSRVGCRPPLMEYPQNQVPRRLSSPLVKES